MYMSISIYIYICMYISINIYIHETPRRRRPNTQTRSSPPTHGEGAESRRPSHVANSQHIIFRTRLFGGVIQ